MTHDRMPLHASAGFTDGRNGLAGKFRVKPETPLYGLPRGLQGMAKKHRKAKRSIEAKIIMFPAAKTPECDGDGYVVMPEQLTYGMILAAGEAIEASRRDGFIGMITAVYEAMKAAAPGPKSAA